MFIEKALIIAYKIVLYKRCYYETDLIWLVTLRLKYVPVYSVTILVFIVETHQLIYVRNGNFFVSKCQQIDVTEHQKLLVKFYKIGSIYHPKLKL